MTAIEKKLTLALLKLAAEEFDNHGCNDFHLVKDGGLTREEAKKVQEALFKDGMVEKKMNSAYSFDALLMEWLVKKLQK